MKTFNKILTFLATASLFAAGCVNEDPAYKDQKPEPPTANNGFLTLSGLSMRVIYDNQTDTQPDNTQNETQRPKSLSTRTQPDVENFWVELYSPDDTQLFRKHYSELKADLEAEALELPVGIYRLEVYSEPDDSVPAVAWEAPTYGATQEVSIIKGQTTELDEVICTLTNIKVTTMCSVDLKNRLDVANTKMTVSLGTTKVDFSLGETRAAYFKPKELQNMLKFQLTGKFTDGKDASFSKNISDVLAGQWRKITLIIEYADKGESKFDIQVDGFVQDEEITIDGTKSLWEPIYTEPVIDPKSPEITWPGHDLTKPFRVTEAMFDDKGNCTEPFDIHFASPNAIESLNVSISSSNADFMKTLTDVGVPAQFDLCTLPSDHPAYGLLRSIGFPMGEEVRDQKDVIFDLGPAIPMLKLFDGHHTFSFSVTDLNTMTTPAQLVIILGDEAAAPVIEWVGYDLTQRYTLSKDMSIQVNVTAEAGIQRFMLDIDSDALRELVAGVGTGRLAAPFDLCTIDGEEEAFLSNPDIGFKTGADVLGKTSISFDISKFAPTLMSIGDTVSGTPNQYNFRFEVTDNNGNVTTGAIQVVKPTK